MKTYIAIKQEVEALRDQSRTLVAATADREFTAEEQAAADTLLPKLAAAEDELAAAEKRRELELRVAALPGQAVTAGADRETLAPWVSEAEAASLLARFGEKKARGQVAEIGLGRMLQATAAAFSPSGDRDPRLFRAAASGSNSTIPSEGGFLVEEDYSTMLLDRAMETAVLAPRCMEVPISSGSDSIELPFINETSRATGSRWGGVQVYRRKEADTVTATKPTFGELEIKLADMMGLAYATGRLLQDASAMGRIFSIAFASEFAFKLDDEIVRGTGAGECQGLLNATALVSQSKETNQAAATFVYENALNMWKNLHIRSQANAVWYVNQEVWVQLAQMALAVGTAGIAPRFVVYGQDGGLTMFGRPVVQIEQAAALGTVGDVILADLSQYILITKGGLQADQSMHVRFIYDEQTFRWIRRVNGGPTWQAALTPYKGSGTRSPYVVLNTRS